MKGISEKLQAQIPKLKPSQSMVFEVLGMYFDQQLRRKIIPNNSRVPAIDRIYDPWAIEVDKAKGIYQGDYVDITYAVREVPGDRNSMRDTIVELGQIMFTRQQGGQISISGKEPAKMGLAEYLFLSNYNQYNREKPWHIPPKQYIYTYRDEIKEDKAKLDAWNKSLLAMNLIKEMSDGEIREHGKGLFANYKILSDEQIRLKLIAMAEKSPDRIINISKDVDKHMTKAIRDYTEAGFVEKRGNKWVYKETGEDIVTILKNHNAEDTLKRWLLSSEGRQDRQNLEGLLKHAEVKG